MSEFKTALKTTSYLIDNENALLLSQQGNLLSIGTWVSETEIVDLSMPVELAKTITEFLQVQDA